MPAAYTSQTCSACGHRAPDNRDGQAVFRCRACGGRPTPTRTPRRTSSPPGWR
ncbi:transposase [Thermoactinospora rubra]|uniref:transposase n=1 Tax=Thermoactinospora rubra TaxID=1088767 RepID=UPI001F0AFF05|nr:transposase [Thermoactinospora rubra]